MIDDADDQDETASPKSQWSPMEDRQLIAILNAEEVDASSYYTSELAKEQGEALERFFARKYGDEVEGRSQVCAHTLQDTINWLMPDLMRVFLQSDDLITVDEAENEINVTMQQSGVNTQDVAECLRHVMFRDNPGEEIIHDFAFDGLLQRIGVVAVNWEDPQEGAPELMDGVSPAQLQQILSDPEYQVLEAAENEPEIIDGQAVPSFMIEVVHKPLVGRVKIENVPPEEFKISRRAKSIDAAPYHAREQNDVYVSDLARLYPDKAGELDPESTSSNAREIEISSDPRALARHQNEAISTNRETSNHENRKMCTLRTEYIRIDYDGDGYVELRQIKRVGSVILENLRVDRSQFVSWSPIKVAHKAIGMSVADTCIDHQKVATVALRRTIDSLDQSLVPRTVYDKTALDPEDIDALLDAEVGGAIGVRGNPGDKIMPLTTPDLTGSGYNLLEYMDAKTEQATGVLRNNQGLNPDSLTKTASGMDMLQQAGNDRVELYARWLALGVEQVLQRVLELLCAHQDRSRWIKVAGKPVEFDPRRWSDQMAVHVHVGMGAVNRQTMLGNLNIIAAKQEQILMQLGPSNPLCSLQEYGHTLSRMVETMGFKTTEKFFKKIDGPLPEQPPQPDPKLVEVQQKGQIEQAKLEMQAQTDQAKMASQQQLEQMKLQSDREIAAMRIAMEREIAQIRLQAEVELERWKAAEQMKLEQWRAQNDADRSERQAQRDHEVNMNKDRPGGRLDA